MPRGDRAASWLEHDLAERSATLAQAVRVGGLRQRQDLVDDRSSRAVLIAA
jgi:hypothetical protein